MNVVAHNLVAMNAQRQFGINLKGKAKSTEKLSSGYRINRAADDAAGLSISEKMRRQIRGLSKGVENAQDGVSLCQVADGALAEVCDMLHRITELSVKSANGTNTELDREYIQEEISEILKEIDRISDATEFNGMKIFSNQSDQTVKREVEQIVSPADAAAALLGGTYETRTTSYTTAEGVVLSADTYNEIMATMSNYVIGKDVYDKLENGTYDYDGTGGANTNEMQEMAIQVFENSKYITSDISDKSAYKAAIDQGISNLEQFSQATVNTSAVDTDLTAEKYANNASLAIQSHWSTSGGKMMQGASGILVWRARNNGNVQGSDVAIIRKASELLNDLAQGSGDTQLSKLMTNSPTQAVLPNPGTSDHLYSISGDIGLDKVYEVYNYLSQPQEDAQTESKKVWIHSGCEAGDGIYVELDEMSNASLGTEGLDVSTVEGASNALNATKDAIKKVNTARSKIGAQQNRLEHTIANEENIVENTTAAESRIRDTNMAGEMVKYSNFSILEQAGHAMMAQANQSNQGVLSLLG